MKLDFSLLELRFGIEFWRHSGSTSRFNSRNTAVNCKESGCN
jgi:hypothetical protein